MKLPYIHIEFDEGIFIKDVDATTPIHEDLRHPHGLDDGADQKGEASGLDHLNQMIGAINGD